MSAWWENQNLFPGKKGSRWPPDPYMDYGEYTCSKRGDKWIMKGPGSPISGIRLTKTVEFTEDNRLRFSVSAENIRDSSINMALWLNTRLPGNCKCYIPVTGSESIRLKTIPGRDTLMYRIAEGHFTFLSELANPEAEFVTSKACLNPAAPYIIAFSHNQVFIIHFPYRSDEKIHANHAKVEIFNQRSGISSEDLLELEVQTAQQQLAPGATMSTYEIWSVSPYKGKPDMEAHLEYIREELILKDQK